VEVKIGGTTVFPTLARLAPGFVGLYEVRVIVPNTAENGTHLVQVLAAQVSSNSAPLVVLGDSLDNRRVLKTSYGVPPL
jgi:uncharacterized protein (TIGR03437 family)